VKIADIPVRDLSDDDMLHIMVKENSTQKGGQSVAATLDSVKAVLRRLSYLLLSRDFDDLGKILPRLFDSEKSYHTAKGQLLTGNGLGHRVIGDSTRKGKPWLSSICL